MMTKYQVISALADETAMLVAKNGQSWMKYLDTAARLYKRPFNEQLLIFAQRPEASVCASLEEWNEKMFCWVNRGAKGIALIDTGSERPKLKYVFDVSDVHKAKRIGRDPYIWELKENHKEAVLARLERTYGGTDARQPFEQRIIEIAERIAADYYEELLPEIGYVKEDSFLEELDELNVGLRIRDTLASSIAYTVLSRCGADMGQWAEELDFTHISDFNTPATLAVIGNATTQMSKSLILEIGRAIVVQEKQAARQKQAEAQKNIRNIEKGLAKEANTHYNTLKRESETTEQPVQETAENKEREGIAYGTDIREKRGLPDSEPDTERRTGGDADQVRIDAQELSERTQGRDLSGDASVGKAESTLPYDTGAGRAENGFSDSTDGKNRGRDGGTESSRPDEVGGDEEQHQTRSGGNRADGADLHLSSDAELNRGTSEPDSDYNSGDKSLSGSFFYDLRMDKDFMEIQKGILCSDLLLKHKRPEIAGYFQAEQDADLQTEYLKNSFRMGKQAEFDIGEIKAGYSAGEDGITMWKGNYLTREAACRISWEDARYWVNAYMEDGVYLLPGEKAEQIDTDGMYKQLDLFTMFAEQIGNIAMKQAEEKSGVQPMAKIPQEHLDEILRSGGGRDDNRKRIYAKYRQGKTPEEMVAFLKKEYGTTGKGFEFDGKQIAVWFNESGMTAGFGTSALENPAFTMSWPEIEAGIRSQVESGTYMGANEAYLVDETERNRIATHTAYFFYDGMGEMPEEIFQKVGNRSDAHAKMVELLSSPEGIALVASHMDNALHQLETGEKKLRFRSVLSKEELRAELDNLLVEKREFPTADSVEIKKEDFITQDEIDHRLGRGSGFQYGSFRIYDYYMEGHDSKDAVKFLKKEYGTGGSSHALPGADHSWEDHNGKGITLDKGNIMDPYTTVLLSWRVVEKRIRKLIEEDKYLSPSGKEAYARYKEEQAQKALEQAQAKMERETKVACKDAIERAIAEKFDGRLLPKDTAEAVIREYGIERVTYVLANTVAHKRQDERFSEKNKEWAKEIEPHAMWENRDMVADSHPVVLNGFINQTRRYIEIENELTSRAEEEQARELRQNNISDISEGELDWHIVHDMDDDDGKPMEWSAALSGGGFLWIDKEAEGYALYDTHNTDAAPVSVSETLDGAKENGEYYAAEQATVLIDGQECVVIDEWEASGDKYILGNSVEDGDFFYAEVNGHTHFEYDHKPDRKEIEDDYIDIESMRDIDRHEAEVFARFEGGDDFQDIDTAAIREKLENGEADREADEMLAFAKDAAEAWQAVGEEKTPFDEPEQDTSGHDVQKTEQPETDTSGHDVQKRNYRVGTRVYLDNKFYEITRTDDWNVEIMDRTLFNPPRRLEGWENFEKLLRQDERNAHLFSPEEKEADQRDYTTETVAVYPGEKNNLPYDVVVEKLHFGEPEKAGQEKAVQIDKSGAVNFHITDEGNIDTGFSSKEKFMRNMDAIRTLKKIEDENRIATLEEQKILSQYVGWGGLADAFDETKANWAEEYRQLKNLLSPQEYASARESTLNAHYTSPVIIRSIYEALEKMGFEKGNILEPSLGIGNFFGMLPEKMQESRIYGVELDDISGRIAKQLYPNADIRITGFEKTNFPDDFFDIAVGNVPFGSYKVSDKRYDKQNFLVHDYFFAKSIDKVRRGGVIAMITSNGMSGGTFDKRDSKARRYIAQRCDLLGAIRLPSGVFEDAGLPTDILFFQKRERQRDLTVDMPDWVQTTIIHESDHVKENGEVRHNIVTENNYFLEHPEMVLGKQEIVSGPFGPQLKCLLTEGSLEEKLKDAVVHIQGEIENNEFGELEEDTGEMVIPADPDVKNYSYTLVDDKVYYRENSIMKPVDLSDSMQERVRGMVGIRNCTQELIRLQLEEYPDSAVKEKQAELNTLYDNFSKKYGMVNSQTNKRAFNQDASYCLLCSLEKLDEEGNFKGKADMFSKRTIKRAEVVTSVDTASEALAVSLSEKARVDLDYMAELAGKDVDAVKTELAGVIFQNPVTDKWETADEYLSGNVREKLETAKVYAENHPEYAVNVQALTRVQPEPLDASEIDVRIGATWIDPKYIEDFMRDTLETPPHLLERKVMGIQYTGVTGQWNVKGKNADTGNSLVNMTYGTSRRNAYQILEDSLNLKDSRVYDTIVEDGKEKRVLNKKETTIVSQKQEAIREAFKDWVFRDQQRRQDLVEKYNKLFNSTRPREYNGDHLKFPGMTPDIELKPHQKNAVAHVLYGDNTLLAHCVGAGKTFEMTAAAMESRRLGLCQKSLFVVPNHLTEQWASDFLRLYPGANILAATKKDFEPANRKKFCSRIATGEYDAVIIGHSQFEKIPLSPERQVAIIERQIDEIELAIAQVKADNGERYTIKQMEKLRKALDTRLEKLNDTARKDNVVTFEQLGVDRLFVDESHNYKNLFLYTKMRNVAGIAQSEAQKSSDMFAKCQYLDELTGGRGVTFATGTPISNSMTELYTNMRYLQYGTLQKLGLGHFDSWASSFGETQTAIELAPEGTGYRAKTRFAKFFNLPELISLFKESADIQTPDMLKLPVPEAEYENVVLKPSKYQQDMVASLADRAEAVRDRKVDATVDNMLKITNDGRKLALDQRLINDMLPDEENSKASVCVDKAFEIWEQTKEQKSAQILFCDLSTPKGDGTFNVYEDIRDKLIKKGVPPEEIAFIHEANTELRKAELFGKVRSGQVRFLLGSTQKMGAGTNVQDRLIALHHLDVPWRPSDIEQQEGRILRQGNLNPKVKIFRYVTEGTFDSYSWQVIENKQKFISQIMTSKSPVRSCEDVDEAALSYAEVKALATGNPYIREKMDLDIQVSKLKLMKANHTSQKYRLEDRITAHYPYQITRLKERIRGLEADIQTAKANLPADKEMFSMKVGDKFYTDKKEAGTALVEMCRGMHFTNLFSTIGEYAGFKMAVSFESFGHKFVMDLKGQLTHNLELGTDPLGNITRINHALESMPRQLAEAQTKLESVERQLETAKIEVEKPFAQEAELAEKLNRLSALNALLNMDEKGGDAANMGDAVPEQTETDASGHDVQKTGQPETDASGHDVQKTEQPETDTLGHDVQRPGRAADMPKPYPVENARHNCAVENGNPQGLKLVAGTADKPANRASLKEKMEAYRAQVADTGKPGIEKAKRREEAL